MRIARLRNVSRNALLVLALSSLIPVSAAREEMIVTASKKAENLQDVPMSVQAFSATEIDRKGIKDIGDIARFSTSLQFDESFAQSDTRIVVRGLSPTLGRQNAALLLDGVDVSSESITSGGGSLLLNTRLVDIERIEVVLGPQMALYGRSAFNGAIKYITKDAAEEFETSLSVDGGFSGESGVRQYEVIGSMSAPLIGEALGFRVNGAWWDDEGFHRNQVTGQRIGGEKGYGLSLTLNSNIGDKLSMKFRTEFTDDEGQPSALAFIPFNTLLDTPEGAFQAGTAECYPTFVDALGTIPGNNQAYLDRALRTMDPAFIATLDPDTLDPNSPNFSIPGGGPHCERQVLAVTGAAPDGDTLSVNLAPNPLAPGRDYEGFDRELLRLTFITAWEEDNWAINWVNGYTRDDTFENQGSGGFAFRSAAAGEFLDGSVNSQVTANDKLTEQISTDLYITTSFDGPVNGTFGGLYWLEKIDNASNGGAQQASGSHCFWNSNLGLLNPFLIEDGCTGYTETPVAPYVAAAQPFIRAFPNDRDTEHWSIYGQLEFEIAENWTLSVEGRYNSERVDVLGPIFLDPSAAGGPGSVNPCGVFFRACEPFDDWRAGGNWFGDSFFPWTDEAPDGTDLNQWVPNQVMLDNIPDVCWQQDATAVQRSIDDGPVLIQRAPSGEPLWQGGSVVPILDAQGRAQGVDSDGNPVALDSPAAVGTDTFRTWCGDKLNDRDSWFSPKIRLEWAAGDNLLFYVSWADARKPGGFSLATIAQSGLNRDLAEFEAEQMEVWEVGGNTGWFDGSLIVNGSIFYQDFTNKQAQTSALAADGQQLVSKIVNAGKAEVWGSELQIDWSPVWDLLFGGNLRTSLGWTWLPVREYTDFEINSVSPTNTARAGNCTRGLDVCTLSYTGNKLEGSAEHSVNGSFQYMIPLVGGASAFFETDMSWQSERFVGLDNLLEVDSFLEFNLRVGFSGERWEALLYVDNLLNDDTVRYSSGGPGINCCFVLGSGLDLAPQPVPGSAVMLDLPLTNTAFLADPRVIGVRFSTRFGGE